MRGAWSLKPLEAIGVESDFASGRCGIIFLIFLLLWTNPSIVAIISRLGFVQASLESHQAELQMLKSFLYAWNRCSLGG